MRYGTVKETKTTDTNGSTITTETKIHDGKTVNPIRIHTSEREKVKNKKDELTEYLKFSDSLTPDKLDPRFEIERTKQGEANGFYYVVKSYTVLKYE